MTPDERAPSAAEIREEIAREILRVHQGSYGTGASKIDVILGEDTVLLVLDIELTAAERTLISASQHEAVKGTREAYQMAIAPTFIAVVERATGRRVQSFLSSMSVEPLYTIEFFRLEPRSATA
jgi:uncharacterized protein YbcI